MSKITKEQLLNFELSHRHGGNGYVMCEDIDEDYCRVTPAHASDDWGTLAYLASKAHMSPFKEAEISEELVQLRADFKSGKLAAFSTHIMPAKEAKQLREKLML